MTIRNAEHARSRPMTEPPATARGARSADTDDWDPDSELSETSKAVIATVFGLALLIAAFAAFAAIGRLGGRAADYGTILVYLAFFLWMSIAGRVFWWGADKLIAEARKKSNTGDRR